MYTVCTVMHPLSNDIVDDLDDEMTQPESFEPHFVDQIMAAKNKLCKEMISVTKAGDSGNLQTPLLLSKNITKEKLCYWLE